MILLQTQRVDRIDSQSPEGGQDGGDERDKQKHHCHCSENDGIRRAGAE